MAEVFAFVVDLHTHKPADKSRNTVFGWAIHTRAEKHEKMFRVVSGLPRCNSPKGAWNNDGYRAWVWFRGSPNSEHWVRTRVYGQDGEHPEAALTVLKNGWHLD